MSTQGKDNSISVRYSHVVSGFSHSYVVSGFSHSYVVSGFSRTVITVRLKADTTYDGPPEADTTDESCSSRALRNAVILGWI